MEVVASELIRQDRKAGIDRGQEGNWVAQSELGTIVQKHQFFGSVLSLWSNSHIHT